MQGYDVQYCTKGNVKSISNTTFFKLTVLNDFEKVIKTGNKHYYVNCDVEGFENVEVQTNFFYYPKIC